MIQINENQVRKQTDKSKSVARRARKATGFLNGMDKEMTGLTKRGEKPGFSDQKISPGFFGKKRMSL